MGAQGKLGEGSVHGGDEDTKGVKCQWAGTFCKTREITQASTREKTQSGEDATRSAGIC